MVKYARTKFGSEKEAKKAQAHFTKTERGFEHKVKKTKTGWWLTSTRKKKKKKGGG